MGTYLPKELQNQLEEMDNRHCAYCRTTELNSGQIMTIAHIIPESRGGVTRIDNLCQCCCRCNEFKGSKTTACDPFTDEVVPLYHPRLQRWYENFEWDETGVTLIGLTAIGRATIVALNINDEVILALRRRWVGVGWHPPDMNM